MFDDYSILAKDHKEKKEYATAISYYHKMMELDLLKFNKTTMFSYSWCLFNGIIKNPDAFEKENEEVTKESIKYIIDHFNNKDLLYQLTVFRVIKNFKNKASFDAKGVNFWLDKLNPDYLPTDTWTSEVKGKSITNQSKKEEWYSLKSKVYLKLEMYKMCIDISSKALIEFEELHNDNDKWFDYRIAISLYNLGNNEESLKILEDLVIKDKRWFFYKDISEIYASIGNTENAIRYGVDAALIPPDDDKKINLYWNLGDLFESIKDSEKAISLKSLSIKIRNQNSWKLSEAEKEFYETNESLINDTSRDKLVNEINKTLTKYKYESMEKQHGIIENIFPNNKAGFIKNQSGESHFFSVKDVIGNRGKIEKSQKVEYYLGKGFDRKKNAETFVAINIKPIGV